MPFALDLLAALGPFEPTPTLAVALSGGADSMALTLLAEDWAASRGGRVVALTIDHRLRAESRAEAQQVAVWMAARGIAHHILTPEHLHAGNNVMHAARSWRYDALAEWCRAQDVLHCLLAHHADDQAETALLHQARGSTEDGGSGMTRIRHYRGVRFLRPLLEVRKEELKNYLHACAADWIEDPSNTRREFARARVRQQLAANEKLRAQTMAGMAEARPARHRREQALAAAARDCTLIHPVGFAILRRDDWMALEPWLGDMLLANALRCISGATQRARHHEIRRLSTRLRAETKNRRSLQHCLIAWRDGIITIAREPARVAPSLAIRGAGVAQWDRRFTVRYDVPDGIELTLRALGQAGKKLLRTQAIATMMEVSDQRIIAALPPATPAVWHLDELVGVPHIAWAVAAIVPTRHLTLGFAPAKPLAATPFW